jgi:eukaryotic-like serine/threonine-protein kinase
MIPASVCPHCHRSYDAMQFCPHDGRSLSTAGKLSFLRWSQGPLSGLVLKNRYRLLGPIGQGAIAVIYLAEDTHTGEPVAAKLLKIASGPSRQRERFFHEVLASSAVGHPGVVKIFDVGEREDRTPYIVMEYLRGETLGDRLRREGAMDPAVALPLLLDVASALAATHQKGIVHRDVKPDNIFLVGAPGEGYAAKLVDFGLAKSTLRLTAMGTAVGTAEYMSPEQALTDPTDARSDLYSLGVVFYRTFTGALPFVADQPTTLLALQVTTPPPMRLLSGVLDLPGEDGLDLDRDDASESSFEHEPELPAHVRLSFIITKMLRKRPDHRYPTMAAMVEDIERLMGKRAGYLEARKPLADDDIYIPQGPFGLSIIRELYKLVRMPPPDCLPPWP